MTTRHAGPAHGNFRATLDRESRQRERELRSADFLAENRRACGTCGQFARPPSAIPAGNPPPIRRQWPSFEIHPDHAVELRLGAGRRASGKIVCRLTKLPWPKDDYPFTPESAPIEIAAAGQTDSRMDFGPIWSCARCCRPARCGATSAGRTVTLIPMGAARLADFGVSRPSASGPDAHEWIAPAIPHEVGFTRQRLACFRRSDTVDALDDGLVPNASNDQRHSTFYLVGSPRHDGMGAI